jgi:hypothetical protein
MERIDLVSFECIKYVRHVRNDTFHDAIFCACVCVCVCVCEYTLRRVECNYCDYSGFTGSQMNTRLCCHLASTLLLTMHNVPNPRQ